MRTAYKVLAYLIALEVVIQAAAIAFAVFGLGKWVEDGGTLDKAAMESETLDFTGIVGFMIHGLNGLMIIPLLALIFFVVSFFAKVPGGVKWAGIVLVAVVVQVLLAMFGHGMPFLGLLHGLNALLIFGMAVDAARRASVTRGTYNVDTSERELV
ncbi:MAG: hypothetical protein ACRDXB_10640 [Actinomycetes bacterium]